MKKTASAVWTGEVKTGKGSISTETRVLRDAPYGFKARFEDGPGTNPEELIGAAHAGCFSMALSMMLGKENLTPDKIETTASVTLDPDALEITTIHLDVKAKVPGADDATFQRIATAAKEGCPVSKVLKGARITMEAKLDA